MDKAYLKSSDQGKVIVFLHYFGGAARSWQWVLAELEEKFQCYSFNLPGFGDTPPLNDPSIAEFSGWIIQQLQDLSITKCTLVGHSMSGKLALFTASLASDLFEHIILVAPSPPTVEPMPESEKERMLMHPDRNEAKHTVEKAIIKNLSQEQFSLAVDTQLEIDHGTWRWWLIQGMNHSIEQQITALRVPITVIASEDDPVIDYDTLIPEITSLLPHTNIVSVRGIGHLIPLESAVWLGKKIREIVP